MGLLAFSIQVLASFMRDASSFLASIHRWSRDELSVLRSSFWRCS